MSISFPGADGKKKSLLRSTGLPVKGNKKKAEKMLSELKAETQRQLNEAHAAKVQPKEEITFSAYLSDWLEMIRPSVEVTTFSAYELGIKRRIIPYFLLSQSAAVCSPASPV